MKATAGTSVGVGCCVQNPGGDRRVQVLEGRAGSTTVGEVAGSRGGSVDTCHRGGGGKGKGEKGERGRGRGAGKGIRDGGREGKWGETGGREGEGRGKGGEGRGKGEVREREGRGKGRGKGGEEVFIAAGWLG